jgi:hypothetical protein
MTKVVALLASLVAFASAAQPPANEEAAPPASTSIVRGYADLTTYQLTIEDYH